MKAEADALTDQEQQELIDAVLKAEEAYANAPTKELEGELQEKPIPDEPEEASEPDEYWEDECGCRLDPRCCGWEPSDSYGRL